MDDPIDSMIIVRCSACHVVYEQLDGLNDDPAGCPECGETVWIAADIPVPENAGRVAA
jgi:rRNA maturation endonuclease Nob1